MNSLESEYLKLETERHTILERARDSARLTLPTLIPDEGDSKHTKFITPYQSVGARGVNNLASSLLLSLLPPNEPFARLLIDDKAKREVEGIEDVKSEVEIALADMERAIMREIESNSFRVGLFEALKHLIVGGNILIHIPSEGGMRVFHLSSYVIQRDPMGNVDRIITKETISINHVSEEVREAIGELTKDSKDTVDLYTCVQTLPNDQVEVHQEINGNVVKGSEGTYKADESPYIALRLNRVDGEDYGRGYVEEYIGALESLEGLTQSIVEGSAASAKVLYLVAPNGTTRASTLANAPNGAIREGNATDVSTLQVQKGADFRVALEAITQIRETLNFAFMLTEGAIRQAERVTAEEVRLVTQSLEKQLGGIYSVLSQEFQLPLVKILMRRMQKANKLPKLPKGFVTPVIVTGVDALGRGQDLNKLDSFVAGISQVLGPEALSQHVNVSEYLSRRASALGIDTKGLVKSEEELQAEMQAAQQQQQQQQQMQMMQTLGPEAIKSATSMNNTQANNNAQQGGA